MSGTAAQEGATIMMSNGGSHQDWSAGKPPDAGGSAPDVGAPHEANPRQESRFTPLGTQLPTEPYELRIPTLVKGQSYDVDTVMRHAAFDLLCWFLDNEYPGHVEWDPADVQEMADLRQWWETHWNMEPVNTAAHDEILHMHHRLVEISMRLWV